MDGCALLPLSLVVFSAVFSFFELDWFFLICDPFFPRFAVPEFLFIA